MKFIRDLMARKAALKAAPVVPDATTEAEISPATSMPNLDAATKGKFDAEEMATADAGSPEIAGPAPDDLDSAQILEKINASVSSDAGAAEPASVNIWDMDGEEAAPAPAPEADTGRKARRRRNQTRVLGFNPMEADVVSIFDKAEVVAPAARAKFPVGWILVVSGPGRGECFSLESGMSQIGRGEDQAVQLDFGDNTISRTNHAAIVYDAETHNFMLGHGGKKNIVRLNGKPVISNEELTTNDEIKIGETGLRFVALCDSEFNWGDKPDDEENEDVAIA